MLSQDSVESIIRLISSHFKSSVRAIYLFGSQISGQTHGSSDLDLAVLLVEKPDADDAYALKTDLSAHFSCDIDLIDLMRADSVTKAQIISTGRLLYVKSASDVAAFETQSYSEYALLNEERADIIKDFLKRGTKNG